VTPRLCHHRHPTATPVSTLRTQLIARDKANLDITWLRDESLEDSTNLPPPGVLAAEIVEELEAALAQFAELAASLPIDGEAREA
jgi:type I restriction enzyme M protein